MTTDEIETALATFCSRCDRADMARAALYLLDQAGLTVLQQDGVCDAIEDSRFITTDEHGDWTDAAVAADGREYHGALMADLDNLGFGRKS